MRPPNKVAHYNPDPAYLRSLIGQIGLSQREIAKRLGYAENNFRRHLIHADRSSYRPAPYLLQVVLECWAASVD
ncbi:MAG TPA: hypothetical protein ENI94_12780 [Gammaproteobacteria bacterium]|nr:hypothetical protein [Gammaproteobacteria bacterium]